MRGKLRGVAARLASHPRIAGHRLFVGRRAGGSPVGKTVNLKAEQKQGTSFLASLGTLRLSPTPERAAPADSKTVGSALICAVMAAVIHFDGLTGRT